VKTTGGNLPWTGARSRCDGGHCGGLPFDESLPVDNLVCLLVYDIASGWIPLYEPGRLSVERLLGLMNDPPNVQDRQVVLPNELVQRSTSGPRIDHTGIASA